ncbi:Protein PROTON GRADIENT REGULATION 5, chloroplastic [Musa troglodytarum]|uniref:Protein PROTON GRADIENT REGULATION 5, chloroplastic n=1 Tax=Musa troglodytarum TaxID=320322 RepID=A0A9E7JX99_9LILI|nr:Protein PROTON GRADIENT REGULATION 5, chloroplastic [Musa troglodytarum]
MATSVSAAGIKGLSSSTFHGSWTPGLYRDDRVMLATAVRVPLPTATKPIRSSPKMGNVNDGKGVFAPVVVLARNVIGRKRFNQLRGKAIALHSQMPNIQNPSQNPK